MSISTDILKWKTSKTAYLIKFCVRFYFDNQLIIEQIDIYDSLNRHWQCHHAVLFFRCKCSNWSIVNNSVEIHYNMHFYSQDFQKNLATGENDTSDYFPSFSTTASCVAVAMNWFSVELLIFDQDFIRELNGLKY